MKRSTSLVALLATCVLLAACGGSSSSKQSTSSQSSTSSAASATGVGGKLVIDNESGSRRPRAHGRWLVAAAVADRPARVTPAREVESPRS
jgi:hypothetical protein